jgi:16S rRNA (cytidine1402-2'-O)-methyltransferase
VPITSKGTEAEAPSKPSPGLYLTAVPIGNAQDITLRALDILRRADTVACEDTRHTRKLLDMHGISASLVAYHEHNAAAMRPILLDRIRGGEAVALVSDAGLPLVSDPGFKLARAARDAGLMVTCLPGASAPLTGLLLSGLPTDRFLFAGFPPPRTAARRSFLAEMSAIPATLVFFESPRRLPDSLADMADILGPREAAVTRELTKLFEEVRRARLPALAAAYRLSGPPKGEIVVVVGPPDDDPSVAEEDVDGQLRTALAGGSLRDAVNAVAIATGMPRKAVYARALALSGDARDKR